MRAVREFLVMLAVGLAIGACLIWVASAEAKRRPAFPKRWVIVYVCPITPSGRVIQDRGLCFPERRRAW